MGEWLVSHFDGGLASAVIAGAFLLYLGVLLVLKIRRTASGKRKR